MPKHKKKPLNGILTAEFDSAAKKIFSPEELKEARALVLISISGNKSYQEENFGVIARNVIQQFRFVTFLVVDELHKYNLMAAANHKNDEDADEFKRKAYGLGSDWIKKHFKYFLEISGLTEKTLENKLISPEITNIKDAHGNDQDEASVNLLEKKISAINSISKDKFEIICWRQWIEKYSSNELVDEKTFMGYCDSISKIKSAVEETAKEYSKRKSNEPKQDKLVFSEKYLTAETQLVPVAAKGNYNLIFYAGKMPKWFEPAHIHFIRSETFKATEVQDDLSEKLISYTPEPHKVARWGFVSILMKTYSRSNDSLSSDSLPEITHNVPFFPAKTLGDLGIFSSNQSISRLYILGKAVTEAHIPREDKEALLRALAENSSSDELFITTSKI